MNTTRHLQLAGVLLAAISASSVAAADSEQPRIEVVRSLAEIEAARSVLATPSFGSTYQMETGERLTVGSRASALRVRYAEGAVATLRHDGQGRFVSQDGQISLRFALNADGEADRVTLAMPAR